MHKRNKRMKEEVNQMNLLEFNIDSYQDLININQKKYNKIELCSNKFKPTTASRGLMSEIRKYTNENNISLNVTISPDSTKYNFNDNEIKIMEADIFSAQELGIDGIKLNILSDNNELDKEALKQLSAAAAGMQLTFGEAFEEIPNDKQKESLSWLNKHGITRLKISSKNINDNLLKEAKNNNIQVVPIIKDINLIDKLNEKFPLKEFSLIN